MTDKYTSLLDDSLDGRHFARVRRRSGSVPSTAVSQLPGTAGWLGG